MKQAEVYANAQKTTTIGKYLLLLIILLLSKFISVCGFSLCFSVEPFRSKTQPKSHSDWYMEMEIILVELGLFLFSNASVVKISERESVCCLFLCLVYSARGCLIIHNFHPFFPSCSHRIKQYHLFFIFGV